MGASMTRVRHSPATIAAPSEFRVRRWYATDFLHFPPETLAVMTPFRKQVITYIYRTALDLAKGSLDVAEISATGMPDEEDGTALDLILTVDGDWQMVQELRCAILGKVAEWSKDWSSEQQRDYGQWIFVCVEPRCA